MPVHLAITRRVRLGCEADFQQALREFFGASFAHGGVLGVSMIVPPPGSDGREYGILRTFADATERDAFYSSSLFKAWDERVRPLTEGEPVQRELHGLEAWFRAAGNPPARWKMAVVTAIGVYALSPLLARLVGPWLAPWPLPLRNAASTVLMVSALTWVVMPFLTRHLRPWLSAASPQPKTTP